MQQHDRTEILRPQQSRTKPAKAADAVMRPAPAAGIEIEPCESGHRRFIHQKLIRQRAWLGQQRYRRAGMAAMARICGTCQTMSPMPGSGWITATGCARGGKDFVTDLVKPLSGSHARRHPHDPAAVMTAGRPACGMMALSNICSLVQSAAIVHRFGRRLASVRLAGCVAGASAATAGSRAAWCRSAAHSRSHRR